MSTLPQELAAGLFKCRFGSYIDPRSHMDDCLTRAKGLASLLAIAADNAAHRGDDLMLRDVSVAAACIETGIMMMQAFYEDWRSEKI